MRQRVHEKITAMLLLPTAHRRRRCFSKKPFFTARIQFKHKIAQRKEKQNNSRWTFSTKQIIYATTLTHTEKVDKSRYHCNSQLLTEFTMMAAPKIISGKMSSQTSATIYLGGGWVVGYSPSTLARPISMFAYVYVLVNMYMSKHFVVECSAPALNSAAAPLQNALDWMEYMRLYIRDAYIQT